ncbi:hypothetical protein GSB9_00673 [Flavobacteriaceae bacterium GSB9]|nr:hypothetical protein GSB9_00673 [Flavobacteriaceae bacterium GSB9]
MYKISFIPILVFGLTLTNCDGRKTQRDALKESIQKFKDSITPIEIVEYIPKTYSEVKTDTILSNGFVIKIKNYTDMENSVSHQYQTDSFTMRTDIYRDWVSEVTVEKDGELIFSETIDDLFLIKNDKVFASLKTTAIKSGTILKSDFINNNEHVYLFTNIIFPDNQDGLAYMLKINKSGKYFIKRIVS